MTKTTLACTDFSNKQELKYCSQNNKKKTQKKEKKEEREKEEGSKRFTISTPVHYKIEKQKQNLALMKRDETHASAAMATNKSRQTPPLLTQGEGTANH